MAEEISELVVKLTPQDDGATDMLREHREEFEKTADSSGESANELGGFARKFSGAGIVFATVFATMAAGIASKMPIFKEAFTAMDSLLTVLGIKFDEAARKGGAEGFAGTIFGEVIPAVEAADGPFQALAVGIAGVSVAILETVAGLAVQLNKSMKNTFQSAGLAGLEAFLTFSNQLATAVSKLGAQIQTRFEVMWDLSIQAVKVRLNVMAAAVDRRVNDIIEAFNRIPGVNIGRVSIPRFETRTPGQIRAAGAQRLAQRTQAIERRGERGDALIREFINALSGVEQTVRVEIDGKEVGRAAANYLAGRQGSRGRNARF